ncbi:MAG: c-type cytochrome [Geminicoccales bacterium]
MASSLETNKILAAVLTAGIFASGAGVVSRIIYHPTMPEEPAYLIEVAAVSEDGGDAGAEPVVSLASLLPAADLAAGEKGAKKCSACHTFDEGGANKIGPNLWDVLGRDIGSVSGFAYSEALTGIDGDWTFDNLDAFLAKPKDYAPGTKMAYAGMKNAGDRADLILYLRSLAADPMPLPEAEEQESAENVESEAEEVVETVTAAVDDTSTAVAEEVADAAEEVVEATEAAAEAASGAAEQTMEAVEQAQDVVTDEAAKATDAATTSVVEAAKTASDAAGDAVESAGDGLKATTEAVTEAASETVESVSEQASSAVETASETVTGAAGAVTAAAGATVAAVTEAVSGSADQAGAGEASGLVAMIADADVAAGEKVSKKCKACHVFDEGGKNKLGPALWGIVGRDIASHEGFNYSGALAELEGDWTYETLDAFLAAPKTYVSGTKMVFAGVKKEGDRANLIAYLRTLAAEPAPLADDG